MLDCRPTRHSLEQIECGGRNDLYEFGELVACTPSESVHSATHSDGKMVAWIRTHPDERLRAVIISSDSAFTRIDQANSLNMAQRFVNLVQVWTASMGVQTEIENVKR